MYGGYWADLDVCWLGNDEPASTLGRHRERWAAGKHEVVLFTEYQRLEGQYVKAPEHCYWQGDDKRDDGTTRPRATVNLGFAHSVGGAWFWELCYDSCVNYWTLGKGARVDWRREPPRECRKNRHWNAHQCIVQDLAKQHRDQVFVEEPCVAYPLFRFLLAWPCGDGAPKWGLHVYSPSELAAGSFVINLWTGIWKKEMISAVNSFSHAHLQKRRRKAAPKMVCARRVRKKAAPQMAPRGAVGAADRQNMIGAAVSCEGFLALLSAGVEVSLCHTVVATAMRIADDWGPRMVGHDPTIEGWRGTRVFATIYLEKALDQEVGKDWTSDRLSKCRSSLLQTLGVSAEEQQRAFCVMSALGREGMMAIQDMK